MRPDHLEELLTSIGMKHGMDPERILRAKERIKQKQRVEAKRKKEPRIVGRTDK